eukprot:766278-Hanusia_phi.AAC.3
MWITGGVQKLGPQIDPKLKGWGSQLPGWRKKGGVETDETHGGAAGGPICGDVLFKVLDHGVGGQRRGLMLSKGGWGVTGGGGDPKKKGMQVDRGEGPRYSYEGVGVYPTKLLDQHWKVKSGVAR